ncbi:MAG TPA: amidase [Terriglobales bacterium]|nr:amidase [Terriglobales bacterium]
MARRPAKSETAGALHFLSLTEVAALLRKKAVSPVELTHACLKRIEALNPLLNAFLTVTAEAALERARAAEREIARGRRRGPLHGIPIALKDLIDTAGIRTTAASAVFAERLPQHDAEVVRRLKAAGAVLLGKLNLHEFAYGGSGVIGHFGPARNPWDPARITGGSSSGSAAAVAAGMCYAALGTDTAGSIRLPAACCGSVGLKPTYGLVSARGVIPLAWSYDHVGPMARSVADAAAVLAAIAGYDPEDVGSQPVPVADYGAALKASTSSLRLGVAREFFFAGLDPEVSSAIEKALQLLAGLVKEVRDVTVPVDADRTVMTAEAWAYHAPRVAEQGERYHPETLRRIRTGAEVTAAAYLEKRRELELLRRRAGEIFSAVDLVVAPTTPVPPPSFAELEENPQELRPREMLMLRNTRPFNVLGLPTLSLPCGFTAAGLPVGLQVAGPAGGEAAVLGLAHAYERSAGWIGRHPSLPAQSVPN